MLGTFGGALEARQIDASDGKLTADVTGEVEVEEAREGNGSSSRLYPLPRNVQFRFLLSDKPLPLCKSRLLS